MFVIHRSKHFVEYSLIKHIKAHNIAFEMSDPYLVYSEGRAAVQRRAPITIKAESFAEKDGYLSVGADVWVVEADQPNEYYTATKEQADVFNRVLETELEGNSDEAGTTSTEVVIGNYSYRLVFDEYILSGTMLNTETGKARRIARASIEWTQHKERL